jgi:sulfate/thiosulfate transport system ATP-binding protein
MTVAVRIDQIVKEYSKTPALRGVTLDIAAGELLALLGPSGSGKTTLLRLIAGLEQAASGRILFDGQDISHVPIQERRIGFVFQNYALFKHMTVQENIAFGLRMKPRHLRLPEREIMRRVQELLDFVQLPELGHRFPAQLSGGQRQRVAIARAFAIEPRILLLDEPFGALDAQIRKDLRQWLRALHRQTGHTTIFVTHDQQEAMELADRVVVLNQGHIEQVGPPATLYDDPVSAFVCQFIGETNRLDYRQNYLADAALAKQRFQTGDHCYVRPQDIQLGRSDEFPLKASVVDIVRHGGLWRLQIRPDGEEQLLEVDVGGYDAPTMGSSISFALRRAHIFAAPL